MIGPRLPERHLVAEPRTDQSPHLQPSGLAQEYLLQATDLHWQHKFDIGCGLHNLGNSCFLNSVLQCLASLPPVRQAVNQGQLHGFACACPIRARSNACAVCLLEVQLSRQLARASTCAVAPDALHKRLQYFSKSFVRGRQEDAHEFLLAVLDAVERDSRRGLLAYRHPKTTHTLIEQLFCGRLQSQVQCLECGHCSNTYETVTSLSLDVQRGVHSLEQSLAHFTAAENLDGANKYKCSKCDKLVAARKSLSIYDEPNLLVIHLKRFDIFSPTAKISRHIEFKLHLMLPGPAATTGGAATAHHPATNGHSNGMPVPLKPCRPLLSSVNGHSNGANGSAAPTGQPAPRSRVQYMLCGVVVHTGLSVHSGHYVAYVKNSLGKWYCANDNVVYPATVQEVLQQQAYLLFYHRVALKPLAMPPPVELENATAPSSPAFKRAPLATVDTTRDDVTTAPRDVANGRASRAQPHTAVIAAAPPASSGPARSAQVATPVRTPSAVHQAVRKDAAISVTCKPQSNNATTVLPSVHSSKVPKVVLLPRASGAASQQQLGSIRTDPRASILLPQKRHQEDQAPSPTTAPLLRANAVAAHEQRSTKRAAESAHAATHEAGALRDTLQAVHDQLQAALRETPECMRLLRALAKQAHLADVPLANVLAHDLDGRQAAIKAFLPEVKVDGTPIMCAFWSQLEKVVRTSIGC